MDFFSDELPVQKSRKKSTSTRSGTTRTTRTTKGKRKRKKKKAKAIPKPKPKPSATPPSFEFITKENVAEDVIEQEEEESHSSSSSHSPPHSPKARKRRGAKSKDGKGKPKSKKQQKRVIKKTNSTISGIREATMLREHIDPRFVSSKGIPTTQSTVQMKGPPSAKSANGMEGENALLEGEPDHILSIADCGRSGVMGISHMKKHDVLKHTRENLIRRKSEQRKVPPQVSLPPSSAEEDTQLDRPMRSIAEDCGGYEGYDGYEGYEGEYENYDYFLQQEEEEEESTTHIEEGSPIADIQVEEEDEVELPPTVHVDVEMESLPDTSDSSEDIDYVYQVIRKSKLGTTDLSPEDLDRYLASTRGTSSAKGEKGKGKSGKDTPLDGVVHSRDMWNRVMDYIKFGTTSAPSQPSEMVQEEGSSLSEMAHKGKFYEDITMKMRSSIPGGGDTESMDAMVPRDSNIPMVSPLTSLNQIFVQSKRIPSEVDVLAKAYEMDQILYLIGNGVTNEAHISLNPGMELQSIRGGGGDAGSDSTTIVDSEMTNDFVGYIMDGDGKLPELGITEEDLRLFGESAPPKESALARPELLGLDLGEEEEDGDRVKRGKVRGGGRGRSSRPHPADVPVNERMGDLISEMVAKEKNNKNIVSDEDLDILHRVTMKKTIVDWWMYDVTECIRRRRNEVIVKSDGRIVRGSTILVGTTDYMDVMNAQEHDLDTILSATGMDKSSSTSANSANRFGIRASDMVWKEEHIFSMVAQIVERQRTRHFYRNIMDDTRRDYYRYKNALMKELGSALGVGHCARYLRAPVDRERPCIWGNQCVAYLACQSGVFSDTIDRVANEACFTCREFYTADEESLLNGKPWPEKQRSCLLCYAIAMKFMFYYYKRMGKDAPYLLQNHCNKTEGEDSYAIGNCFPMKEENGRKTGFLAPVVMRYLTSLRISKTHVLVGTTVETVSCFVEVNQDFC
jgi:hypothetical protein